jgi:hypothetical protein
MVEKIKSLDLNTINESDSTELLDNILKLEDVEIKECINTVIDSIEYTDTEVSDIDEMNVFHKLFFNNDKVKTLMEDLLKEYETETESDSE